MNDTPSDADPIASTSTSIPPIQPQDLVAAFHTSFHFTQGNNLDWSASIDDEAFEPILKGVEFSSLPSGLHDVEQDVLYFTRDGHEAVAVFLRTKTAGKDERRGFHMESFGVLLAQSSYPRPWRHVSELKQIRTREALEAYFDTHKASTVGSEAAAPSPPLDWEAELLSVAPSFPSRHPLFHLPHLLRIIGPSFLTIFKYVLSRRRVLIYTRAPIEVACLLAKVCVDIAFRDVNSGELEPEVDATQARDDRRPPVLGVVGLTDMDRLKSGADTGLGWIACTTDAIYLERPALYDLVVDLTTASSPLSFATVTPSTPTSVSRPTLSSSRLDASSSKAAKLQQVRFTFSDVRLWNRLDKLLRDPSEEKKEKKGWSDIVPWRLYSYEDFCLVCASIWLKGATETGVKLEGDDDALFRARSKSAGDLPSATPAPNPIHRRAASQSTGSRKLKTTRSPSTSSSSSSSSSSSTSSVSSARLLRYAEYPADVRTTLMLLDIFHSQAAFWLNALQALLDQQKATGSPKLHKGAVQLTPQNVAAMQLSVFSDVDSRFVEWLAQARFGRKASVKRSWRDLVTAAIGL